MRGKCTIQYPAMLTHDHLTFHNVADLVSAPGGGLHLARFPGEGDGLELTNTFGVEGGMDTTQTVSGVFDGVQTFGPTRGFYGTTDYAVVPEPSTCAPLIGGLVVMG